MELLLRLYMARYGFNKFKVSLNCLLHNNGVEAGCIPYQKLAVIEPSDNHWTAAKMYSGWGDKDPRPSAYVDLIDINLPIDNHLSVKKRMLGLWVLFAPRLMGYLRSALCDCANSRCHMRLDMEMLPEAFDAMEAKPIVWTSTQEMYVDLVLPLSKMTMDFERNLWFSECSVIGEDGALYGYSSGDRQRPVFRMLSPVSFLGTERDEVALLDQDKGVVGKPYEVTIRAPRVHDVGVVEDKEYKGYFTYDYHKDENHELIWRNIEAMFLGGKALGLGGWRDAFFKASNATHYLGTGSQNTISFTVEDK